MVIRDCLCIFVWNGNLLIVFMIFFLSCGVLASLPAAPFIYSFLHFIFDSSISQGLDFLPCAVWGREVVPTYKFLGDLERTVIHAALNEPKQRDGCY